MICGYARSQGGLEDELERVGGTAEEESIGPV